MSPIEIQNYACNLAFDIVSKVYGRDSLHKVFPIYEMIVEDFYYRQSELLDKELEKYFDGFVDVNNLCSLDNTQEFYVSSSEREISNGK